LLGILKVIEEDSIRAGTVDGVGKNLLLIAYDNIHVSLENIKTSDIRAKIDGECAKTAPQKPESLFTDKLQIRINKILYEFRNER
jgi:hypothetical protein